MCKRCNDFQISFERYQKFISDLRLLMGERKTTGKALYRCAERNDLSCAIIDTLFEYKFISVAWDQHVEVDLNGFDRNESYNVKFHCQSEDNLIHFIHRHEVLVGELSELRTHTLNNAVGLFNQNNFPSSLSSVRITNELPNENHHCAHCGSPIPEGKRVDTIYCSESCRNSAKRQRRKCAHCNASIPEWRNDRAIYCSDSCKTMACMKRKGENKNHEPTFREMAISLFDVLFPSEKKQITQSHESK